MNGVMVKWLNGQMVKWLELVPGRRHGLREG